MDIEGALVRGEEFDTQGGTDDVFVGCLDVFVTDGIDAPSSRLV